MEYIVGSKLSYSQNERDWMLNEREGDIVGRLAGTLMEVTVIRGI